MTKVADEKTLTRPLAAWRIGLTGGVVGILCCVRPTVLRWRLLTILEIAAGTYGALYARTTWLERFS
jgi:hypothetical protein